MPLGARHLSVIRANILNASARVLDVFKGIYELMAPFGTRIDERATFQRTGEEEEAVSLARRYDPSTTSPVVPFNAPFASEKRS